MARARLVSIDSVWLIRFVAHASGVNEGFHLAVPLIGSKTNIGDSPHRDPPEEGLYNKAIRFSEVVQQNPGNDDRLTGRALWAPMRHSGGELWFGRLKFGDPPTTKQLKKDWTAAMGKIKPFEPTVVRTRQGGISRAQKTILKRPLLFRLTALGDTRFGGDNTTARQFLIEKIKELNQDYKTSTGGLAADIYPNIDPVGYQVVSPSSRLVLHGHKAPLASRTVANETPWSATSLENVLSISTCRTYRARITTCT